MPVDDLANLPLSHLFSGPLVAAIDATVQLQEETVELLRETGYDENGDLVTIGFDYLARDRDPETGEQRRVVKRLELPLLLFLTLPNLQISRIEEEFAAQITHVERTERETAPQRASAGGLSPPMRLNVTPSKQATSFAEQKRSTFDLNVTMVAEVQNETRGVELLERAVNNATTERTNEAKTNRLNEDTDREPVPDGGGAPDAATDGVSHDAATDDGSPVPDPGREETERKERTQ